MSSSTDFLDLGPATGTSLEEAKTRFKACADKGLLRHALPETYGGYEDSFFDLVKAHERLGLHTQDPGLVLAINAHLWGAVFPLLKFGTPAQKDEWLPALLSAAAIGGHAITEPQAGSDVSGIEATAVKSDDEYILNGHKRYITNTPIADLLVIYAKVSDAAGMSAFLVRSDDLGVDFQAAPTVKGCATAAMGDVVLTDCRLHKDRLLGKPGAGATMIQIAMGLERAFIFAGFTGVMEWQLDHVIKSVRMRKSGSGTLAEVQSVAHKIAEMKVRLDTSRLWLNRCAELLENGKRITLASAQTKLYASEAFLQSSLDAAHLLGAAGLEDQLPIQVQDAMAGRLLSGSTEIQKNIIAALLGVGAKN